MRYKVLLLLNIFIGMMYLFFLTGCGKSTTIDKNNAVSPTVSILHDPTNLSNNSSVESTLDNSANITSEQGISLKFEKYTGDVNIKLNEIGTENTIILQKSLSGVSSIWLYQKKDSKDGIVYAGYYLNNRLYEIGAVGSLNISNLISASKIQLFGSSVIKISGTCGASCAESYYLSQDNSPFLLLHLNMSTSEVDLDGDGINEILGTVATPAVNTYLFEKQNGQIVYSSLNSQLSALSVSIRNGILVANFKENVVRRYKYVNGNLLVLKQ